MATWQDPPSTHLTMSLTMTHGPYLYIHHHHEGDYFAMQVLRNGSRAQSVGGHVYLTHDAEELLAAIKVSLMMRDVVVDCAGGGQVVMALLGKEDENLNMALCTARKWCMNHMAKTRAEVNNLQAEAGDRAEREARRRADEQALVAACGALDDTAQLAVETAFRASPDAVARLALRVIRPRRLALLPSKNPRWFLVDDHQQAGEPPRKRACTEIKGYPQEDVMGQVLLVDLNNYLHGLMVSLPEGKAKRSVQHLIISICKAHFRLSVMAAMCTECKDYRVLDEIAGP